MEPLIIVAAFGLFVAVCFLFPPKLDQGHANKAEKPNKQLTEICSLVVEGENANTFLRSIAAANPGRSIDNMARRIIKLGEEYGEACEAYLLSTTQSRTLKNKKTHDDVREEFVDAAIVAVDCALTPMPGEEKLDDAQIEAKVMAILAKKLAKWEMAKTTAVIKDDAI